MVAGGQIRTSQTGGLAANAVLSSVSLPRSAWPVPFIFQFPATSARIVTPLFCLLF
jgi:hypothetical protein